MYGNVIRLKNKHDHLQIIDALYDLKTKTLSLGIELNMYPNMDNLEFKIDEHVLYEKGHRNLIEGKVVSIEYDDFDMNVCKGKKVDKRYFTDILIQDDLLYCIKNWKPVYVLDTGFRTEWLHELYHKGF